MHSIPTLILILAIPSLSSAINVSWIDGPNIDFSPLLHSSSWKGKLDYYTGRAKYKGGVLLGHYSPTERDILFGYNGTEKHAPVNEMQILAMPKSQGGQLTWTRKTHGDGKLPYNIVMGGIHPETKERLYVCRARIDLKVNNEQQQIMIPGWVSQSEDSCIISFRQNMYSVQEYEMLALSLYGIVTDSAFD